jgi:hypothetical protein
MNQSNPELVVALCPAHRLKLDLVGEELPEHLPRREFGRAL